MATVHRRKEPKKGTTGPRVCDPIFFEFLSHGFVKSRLFKDYAFERSIALFGQNTGVIMTGILLLRICDPDMKTPVMKDFSISYALTTLLCYAMLLPVIKMIPNAGAIFILTGSVAVVAIVLAVLHARKTKNKTV